MGFVAHIPGITRFRNGAILLLVFSLLCYVLAFLNKDQSHSKNNTIRTKIALLYWQSNGSNDFQPSVPPKKVVRSTPTLLPATSWNVTGSRDLAYPLDVDMPEIVRRVMNNLSVNVKPINKPDFPILISNSDRCERISREHHVPPDLLILIKSAPTHFLQRDAIRLTWGSEHCWGGRRVVRLFLLGRPSPFDSQTAARLADETAFYEDIIQQDFIDHYYNNTYKLLFGIEWAVRFCSKVSMIMFADDDFFVYPRNVVSFIEGLSIGLRQRLIAGYVWRDAIPVRGNLTGHMKKWAISWQEFPNRQYPPYVAAGNFFVSMPIAKELRIAAWYTRYLRFDDVFLGILLKKLIRTPIHLSEIYAFYQVNKYSGQTDTMLSSHNYEKPASQFALWDRLKCHTFCLEQS